MSAFFDAYRDRDVERMVRLCGQNGTFRYVPMGAQGEGRLREEGKAVWSGLIEAFPDLTAELLDVRGQGNKTFARGRLYGTGAGSGAAFERALWLAHEWRDGRLLWWRAFESEAEALSAAGLRE